MFSSVIFFLLVVYMLHATCRPHLPIAVRVSILAAVGGVIYWWFKIHSPEEQDSIIQWVQAHWGYVILGVVAIASLMGLWAMHLRRDEDRVFGGAAEARRSGAVAQVKNGRDPSESEGAGPSAWVVDPTTQRRSSRAHSSK